MTDIQAMLLAQEGKRLKPYTDTLGKVTIGIGRNLDDKGISDDEAIMLLNADIADALDDVRHCCSCYDELSRPRQLVLISMAFNMGRDRLSKFVHFLNAIHKPDYDEAAEEMLASKWAAQVGQRAITLANMMKQDVSPWV